MKTKFYFFMAGVLLSTNIFSQANKTLKPLTEKTVVANPVEKKVTNPQPVKNQPAPAPPTDLQKAVVNIVVGDDGKDKDTYVAISIIDDNKRTAAYYGVSRGSYVAGVTQGEYFPGDNETLPTQLDASEPTGQIDNSKFPPLPILREANLSEFSQGGSIFLFIKPNGHDTWKINSFSVTLYFNNDPGSPHKMTWNGLTVSQNAQSKTLEFDKNFNPIQ